VKRIFLIYKLTRALGLVLDHPNIVHLSSTVLGPGHFYCFFEYVSGLDLVDYIGQCTRLKENEARHIFRQLLSAVEYAHRNHVVHRDLKLENIRYDPQTGIAKVLDFGFANFYTDSTLLSTNCGSPCYASPEIYANQPYKGPEVDVWSLGVCLYGMTIGSLPFDGPNFKSLSKAVRSGKLSFPVFVSDSLKNLVTKMLHPKVSNRATISYISQHPWVMEGYETAPLDYLEYPNTRKKEAMIGEHYVKDLLSMRVREAGSALMDVLECFGARKSMEPPIGFKSRALPDDEATIIDEKDDQLSELREFKNRPKRHERMMTAGAKIKEWWQRLFSMRSRKTRHYLPTEPIEPIEPIESSMNKDLQKDILFQKKNYKNWKLVLRGMHERFATSV
jgi:serine/threonine protein kinase